MTTLGHHGHDIARLELAQADGAFVYADSKGSQLQFGLAFLGGTPALHFDRAEHQVGETVRGSTSRYFFPDKGSNRVHAL